MQKVITIIISNANVEENEKEREHTRLNQLLEEGYELDAKIPMSSDGIVSITFLLIKK